MTQLSEQLTESLKRLAEGAWEPTDWINWWANQEPEAEAELKRSWFLRVKPRAESSAGPNGTAAGSQSGACYVLDAIGLSYAFSDRYRQGAQEELNAFIRARKSQRKELERRYRPVIAELKAHFPRLSRYLTSHLDEVDELAPGRTPAELDALELRLGVELPPSYRSWLQCVGRLSLEGLTFGPEHPFLVEAPGGDKLPIAGMICLADYSLAADGDQVVMERRGAGVREPPVFYYAHSVPDVRPLAPSFFEWIESLPKSPLLRQ